MIKFSAGAPTLFTEHPDPPSPVDVHPKKWTVMLPTNIASVISPWLVSLAQLITEAPLPPTNVPAPLVPVNFCLVDGLNDGSAADATDTAAKLMAATVRAIRPTNRAIFMFYFSLCRITYLTRRLCRDYRLPARAFPDGLRATATYWYFT
jgi:hypothetical protein